MTPRQIKQYLVQHEPQRERTIVIIDFGNVEKWKHSLKWGVGIQELANLVKSFSKGRRYLRRFYYGSDFGKAERSATLDPWSDGILSRAAMNGLEVVTKRVKYIHNATNVYGFEKKCDLDVEMAVDLIRERHNYDNIILFSGDGDLVYALRYLHDEYDKNCVVFGSRNHTGREVFDALGDGVISKLFFAEDFEYRLSMHRRRY